MNKIIRQRVGLAADAAIRGGCVRFEVCLRGEFCGCRLLWRSDGREYVIASGGKARVEALLPEVQAEFERQVVALTAQAA